MSEPFDVTRPSPDAGHEAIRVAVVEAIEELGYNTSDLGFTLDLTDTLFGLVDSLLGAIADLQEQLAALENPPEVIP